MFKCTLCDKEAKSKAGLVSHVRQMHNRFKVTQENPSKPVEIKVRFISPRSSDLSVVIEPKIWKTVSFPDGARQVQIPGKRADFVDGIFETDDKEIIDHLLTKYPKMPGSARFPVFSVDQVEDMRNAAGSSKAGS